MRADLVFSYWVYIWYIIYAFKLISYSPKFPLIVGLIDNIIMLILMTIYNTSKKTIFYFIIINVFIKVLPLYYLLNEQIFMKDILFTCILFTLFMIWILINKQNLVGNMKLIYESLLYEKNKTPFMAFIHKFERNIKQL